MDIPIELIIYHGFILRRSSEGTQVQLVNQLDDPSKIYREAISVPQAMTFTELKHLALERIKTAFRIDCKEHRTESGGTGMAWQIDCTADVDGPNGEQILTKINVPNEGSWEAAKHLMGLAKGDVKLKFLFAVGKGSFLQRAFLKMLVF